LYAGGLWYKPPAKMKYAKETSEVSDEGTMLEIFYYRDLSSRGKVTSDETVQP
jgi:hypothetical protein